MDGCFISYLRVSTDKQGRSGLGLAAQRQMVTTYLNGGEWILAGEYIEVESGRSNSRQQLAAAMAHARRIGGTLLIAKLDRLSRSVAFIANLMESKVPFVACDMPHARPFELHIRASLAEEEARLISERTRAALGRSAKRLGGYRGGPVPDAALSVKARQTTADAFAAQVSPIILEQRQAGATLREIASNLTSAGIRTARGGQWTATAVLNVLARMG